MGEIKRLAFNVSNDRGESTPALFRTRADEIYEELVFLNPDWDGRVDPERQRKWDELQRQKAGRKA